MVCRLAASFLDECNDADPEFIHNLPSSSLLQGLHRQSQTKRENQAASVFAREGLSCPMHVDMVDLGDGYFHPMLRIKDFIKVLALHDRLSLLWGGGNQSLVLGAFWQRYFDHEPTHPAFQDHGEDMTCLLPLHLYADEGQTLKKSAIMVVIWSSPIGSSTRKQEKPCDIGLNYVGSSFGTRFLLSVCLKKVYKKQRERLDSLMGQIAIELEDLYYNGVEVVIHGKHVRRYVCALGLKGDWPIHARIGNLQRSFARQAVYHASAKSGICHLCCAGASGIDPHDYSPTATWRSSYFTVVPWSTPGPLCRIPQSPRKELFHKLDLFNTLHKGCFAELAGSGIVPG